MFCSGLFTYALYNTKSPLLKRGWKSGCSHAILECFAALVILDCIIHNITVSNLHFMYNTRLQIYYLQHYKLSRRQSARVRMSEELHSERASEVIDDVHREVGGRNHIEL